LVLAITALVARRDSWHVRFFGVFAAVVLWIALGKFGYVYRLAAYLPVLRSFRDVENINILVPLSAAVLAGFGFDRFLQPDDSPLTWEKVFSWTGVAVGAGGLLVGSTIIYERYHGMELLSLPEFRRAAGESAVFVLLAWTAAAWLLLLRRRHRSASRGLTAAAIAFLFADLLYASAPLVTAGTPLPPLAGSDAVTRFLAADRSLYRVSGFYDRGPAFGVQDVGGEPSLLLGRYQRYTDALQGRKPGSARPEGPHGVVLHSGFDSTLLGLLNVKYSVMNERAEPMRLVRDPLRLVEVADGDYIYRDPRILPRALAVGGYRVLHDPEAILKELDRDGFEPRATVLLEQEPTLPAGAPSGEARRYQEPGRVIVRSYEDNRVVLRADFAEAGFLVLNDIYYPAWEAEIDGRPATVYRANYLFRAVALPPGQHEVRFIYRDKMLALGARVAALTLFLGVTGLTFERLRRPY
jgi:hypothetical protein